MSTQSTGREGVSEPSQIYFDHAATTPIHPQVVEAMLPFITTHYGNPSSTYALAREARKAMDIARDSVAEILGCRSTEVIFTSGGSESDNLAIKGVAFATQDRGRHIVTTAVEHHAVLHACEFLHKYLNYEVTVVPVDASGRVDPDAVGRALRPDTVLVSVMLANNEIGTIQQVREIADLAHARGAIVHTDAVQGASSLDLDVGRLGVDLLSLSAHKFNGPKGAGVLFVRRGTPILPQQQGGGQERGMRSGTENTASIVGAATALRIAQERRDAFVAHCMDLRDYLVERVLNCVEDSMLTGHPLERLVNNASFAFRGADGEAMLMALDAEGIAASAGSACTSGTLEVSHVLRAIGLDDDLGGGSLRLSLGMDNTRADVVRFVDLLPGIVERAREARRISVG
ncbi:MAG: aminotransferase class V-fold PLP-dependent enzyme [Chloroflexi bacterium]|nr:aminotransferase class V-fold PLP-dependent enzyme [Chloroflexota bacterium]